MPPENIFNGSGMKMWVRTSTSWCQKHFTLGLWVRRLNEPSVGLGFDIWSFRSCPSPASDHRLNWTRYVHHVFLLAGRALKLSRLISRSDRELGYCNVEFIQAVRLLVSRVTVPNTREEKPYNY